MPKDPATGQNLPWTRKRSPLGPKPIVVHADGEEVDYSQPAYLRSREGRDMRALVGKLCDAFGTHLICPRQACRRAGACADPNRADLPFCFYHYRGALRHMTMLAAEHHGLSGHDVRRAPPAEGMPGAPEPFRGRSLVQNLLGAGVAREALERPFDAGRCHWDDTRDPDAQRQLADIRARRLAREGTGKARAAERTGRGSGG